MKYLGGKGRMAPKLAPFVRQVAGFIRGGIAPAIWSAIQAVGVARAEQPEEPPDGAHPYVHSMGDSHIGFGSENPAWDQ